MKMMTKPASAIEGRSDDALAESEIMERSRCCIGWGKSLLS